MAITGGGCRFESCQDHTPMQAEPKGVTMIRKAGNRWQVLSKDGKVLGTHDTKKEAEAQLAAVEIAKHQKKGKRK